ncbi:hypothetical protein [Rufibacter roseolus]|uniref:hypothetical protein n=1 Tax=Rufibacter roseolus TaxID=2817375 RepID=UPI001B30E24A|nr:hypothetical protein [Rufibacter roseolus]
MIDKNTGKLTFYSGKNIFPTAELSEIKALKLSAVQEEQDWGNGWIHYTIRNVDVSGIYFNMTFFYHEKTLKSISFIIKDSPFDMDTGWETWGEQREKEKAEFYNDWLNKELGTDRNFAWGTIRATYDPKSAGSSIVIRYK